MPEHVTEGRNRVADYLTTAEVARRYRTADATVRYWRMTGYGPKGAKCGRKVVYPIAEIERFDLELAAQGA
jgi:hypothetical protein